LPTSFVRPKEADRTKRWPALLKAFSSMLVFGVGACLLWQYRGFVVANVRFEVTYLTLNILGIVSSCILIGLKYQATFWLLGLRLSIADSVAVGLTNRFFNQFFASLGEVLVAVYMKRAHELPLLAYSGLFVATWCLSLLINLTLVGFVVLLFVWLPYGLLLLFGLAVVAVVAWILLKRYLSRPFSGRSASFFGALEAIFRHPSIVAWVVLLDLLYALGMVLRYWASFRLAGMELSWGKSMALVPFANVITMLGITPLGAGLTEYALGYLGRVLDYDVRIGALASSLDRGAMLLTTIVLGPLGYAWLMLRIPGGRKKKPSGVLPPAL
jgi:hypothetical protein